MIFYDFTETFQPTEDISNNRKYFSIHLKKTSDHKKISGNSEYTCSKDYEVQMKSWNS